MTLVTNRSDRRSLRTFLAMAKFVFLTSWKIFSLITLLLRDLLYVWWSMIVIAYDCQRVVNLWKSAKIAFKDNRFVRMKCIRMKCITFVLISMAILVSLYRKFFPFSFHFIKVISILRLKNVNPSWASYPSEYFKFVELDQIFEHI